MVSFQCLLKVKAGTLGMTIGFRVILPRASGKGSLEAGAAWERVAGTRKQLPPLTLPLSSPCCFCFSDPTPRLTSPPRPLTSSSPAPLETSSAPAMSLAVSGRRTSANLKTLRRRSPYTGEAQDTSKCSAVLLLTVCPYLPDLLPPSILGCAMVLKD